MKILFIVPYPLYEAPSQRFRFEQYFGLLEKEGHQFVTQPFLTQKDWKLFFKKGQSIKKMITLIRGYLNRIEVLFSASKFDFIFIHREATPLGPPVVEWILSRILQKKIIFDFDDAIWLTDREDESGILRLLKWRSKVKFICRWSYKVSCGNNYLQGYAIQFNPNAIINPTTIDCENMHTPERIKPKTNTEKVIIGWTGSHSTLKYLETLEPVLKKIEVKFDHIDFLVIADQPPSLNLQRLNFIQWKASSEIEDLSKLDVGIMPLPNDEWANGKCGFKALQYMALEIPTVASPVGVNTQIIDSGVNGFLCSTQEEWLEAIDQLIQDKKLRQSMGENGRKKVKENYSVLSNSANFLSLFAE